MSTLYCVITSKEAIVSMMAFCSGRIGTKRLNVDESDNFCSKIFRGFRSAGCQNPRFPIDFAGHRYRAACDTGARLTLLWLLLQSLPGPNVRSRKTALDNDNKNRYINILPCKSLVLDLQLYKLIHSVPPANV